MFFIPCCCFFFKDVKSLFSVSCSPQDGSMEQSEGTSVSIQELGQTIKELLVKRSEMEKDNNVLYGTKLGKRD